MSTDLQNNKAPDGWHFHPNGGGLVEDTAIERWEDWKWIHDADNEEQFMKLLKGEGL